jgi:hypothetical protein
MKNKMAKGMRNQMLETFGEEYEVTLDYKGEDGYWVFSHKEIVTVQVKYCARIKNNHAKAKEIARQLYPNCVIRCVLCC